MEVFHEAPKHLERDGFTRSEAGSVRGYAIIRNEHPTTANVQKYSVRVVEMHDTSDGDKGGCPIRC